MKKMKIKNNIEIDRSYADDVNKGGYIRGLLLNHYLKKKIGKKYNNKYNKEKSNIIISDNKNEFELINYLEKKKKFNVKENNNWEILGCKNGIGEINEYKYGGYNDFDEMMKKKIKKCREKVDVILKLKNDFQIYKLLKSVLRNENYIK